MSHARGNERTADEFPPDGIVEDRFIGRTHLTPSIVGIVKAAVKSKEISE
jgi:hypothetical protein